MKRLLTIAALALTVGACSSHPKSATATTRETHTITGTFTLGGSFDPDNPNFDTVEGTPYCWGTGGYDDISSGLQVNVSNESGTVIANGSLEDGKIHGDDCEFRFVVNNVPVAKFYKIQVGHRGELSYSYAEMQAAGWTVGFTLG